MKSAHFPCFVDDAGHLSLDNKSAFTAALETFKGRECVLTLQERSYLRSLQANSYYWACVVAPAAKESGQDEETIHSYWCDLFLPNERKRVTFFNRLTGAALQVEIDSRRSSKQTGAAFYDFVENCRLWCQEWLGLTTEDPNPNYWRKRLAKAEVTA